MKFIYAPRKFCSKQWLHCVSQMLLHQVDWRAEIERDLGKMRQEGLSPPQADTELVQQRQEELRWVTVYMYVLL